MQTLAHRPKLAVNGPYVPLFGCAELRGVVVPYRRNEEIFGEGQPTDHLYRVLDGAVRTSKLLSDGRRQVAEFYLTGDVFGLEPGDEHSCSAEAIINSNIVAVRRSRLLKTAEHNSDVARDLWSLTTCELRRCQQHALLLIKSARERLAAFLLDMAERLTGEETIELPMSRQDIADYLGLTVETVSRILTQFAEACVIKLVASRQIILRDRSVLSALNS